MKNKTFDCGENAEADRLLCMLENTSVLSDSFTNRIIHIISVILSDRESNKAWIEESILKLDEEMSWLEIFSQEFQSKLIGRLLATNQKQMKLETLAKKKRSA